MNNRPKEHYIIIGLLAAVLALIGIVFYLYNQVEETSNAVFLFKAVLVGGVGACLHTLKKAKEDDTITEDELKSVFYASIIGVLSGLMIGLTGSADTGTLALSGFVGFGADSVVNGVVKIKKNNKK